MDLSQLSIEVINQKIIKYEERIKNLNEVAGHISAEESRRALDIQKRNYERFLAELRTELTRRN